ncbi:MAG: FAD-dependent oxidoreductase [Acidobacteria bacterium]|nr:FAD-dependent oxidoreductase [Acidobacteriota bacterium]
MSRPRVVILGGGPAGVGAAARLAVAGAAEVTLLEQNELLGGNAGSFPIAGFRADFGSHRLHPACDPEILRDLQALLGPDLLDRPRDGRIRLQGRWIGFPLRPLDLALGLPPSFLAGAAWDAASKPFRAAATPENFATVLERGLGRTICRSFYFPYAEKIWGLSPAALSATQARRRVSAGSPAKLIRKVLGAVPAFRKPGAGRFFYPRGGFGRISEELGRQAETAGARILIGARVGKLEREGDRIVAVGFERKGQPERLEAEQFFSTLPASLAVRLQDPPPPASILTAADSLRFRSMLLIYLVIDRQQYTRWDAHYFPEAALRITRLSEPKNYSASTEPAGRTLLCAELPCDADDAVWASSDDDLARLVVEDLCQAGLPDPGRPARVAVQRLRFAYPIYEPSAEEAFATIDRWLGTLDRFVSFGRQGLFAHDNTHHALAMAYAAARCLRPDGGWDAASWAEARRRFESHVVED